MADANLPGPDISYDANFKALGEDFPAVTPAATTGDENAEGQDQNTGAEAGSEQTTLTPEGDKKPAAVAGDQPSGKPDGSVQSGQEAKGKGPDNTKGLKLADGTVVPDGAARRWFDTARVAQDQLKDAKRQTETIRQQLTEAQAKVQGFESAQQISGALPPQQLQAATLLYRDLMRDLPGTLTKLLAEAKAAGHSIDGIGGAVDTAAIAHLINNQGKRSETEQPTQEQINAQADREVGEFFASKPDAVMHEEVIAQILQKHPETPILEIYYALKQDVIAKGLDWSQPLAPQVAAMKARVPSSTPQSQQAPMLSGRAAATVAEEKVVYTPADGETIDDIVRAAMRDSGIGAR